MTEYQIRNLKSETCRRHSPTELAGGCFIGKPTSLHSQPTRRQPMIRAGFSQYWKSAANLKQLWAALWEQNSQDGSVAPRKKPKSRQRRHFGNILGFWRRQKTFRLQRRLAGRKLVAASTTKSAKRFTLMLHGQRIDRQSYYKRSDRKKWAQWIVVLQWNV